MLLQGLFTAMSAMSLLTAANAACIELRYFKDSEACTASTNPTKITHISINNDCNFLLGDLYKLTCNTESIFLLPCIESPFTTSKDYPFNTCFANGNDGSYLSFVGSCNDVESCSITYTPTGAPTSPPKQQKLIADFIQLPSPPLPPNEFADQPLSVELAHEVVRLAGRLIYQMDDANAASLLPEGYTFHLWKDTGSTEVLIVSTDHDAGSDSGGKIMVVFRGTDETPDGDWLTNINLPKVQYGPDNAILDGQFIAENYFGLNTTYELRVHRGFNNVFSDGLYDTVMATISPLLNRKSADGKLYYKDTIHFFGHSLGGANAQVFGSYFAHFHPNIQTYVTTLGAPRQGNYAYKVFVESRPNLSVWRMVNCRDVVPRVPNFNFYHAGHLIWRKCLPPSTESVQGNDVVEAYYRQSGHFHQGFAEVPKEFIINSYEKTMVSDHLGYAYLEWLGYAMLNDNKNWTSAFVPII